jgi:hypothetical protein
MVKPTHLAAVLPKFGCEPEDVLHFAALAMDVRVLKAVRLWEVSCVTFGAQPAAKILPDKERASRAELRARDAKLEEMAAAYSKMIGGRQ